MFDEQEVIVESVVFVPTGALQLTYYETSDLGEYVAYQRVLTVDAEQIAEEVTELQELLRDVIDKAWVLKRNPPKRLRRREQEAPDDEVTSDTD